ncbi:MAG: septum formation initiator family protein [Oscillospiraceae bacterium]|nr:septum formation initiator family protein [Oscillospiraceae bacterium]
MQIKKASFLTKLVVLTLLIAASVALLRLQGQITAAEAERDSLRVRLTNQIQVNADLKDAVEHSEDPERQADIARNELGLAAPGEKIINFTD